MFNFAHSNFCIKSLINIVLQDKSVFTLCDYDNNLNYTNLSPFSSEFLSEERFKLDRSSC